MRTRLLFTGIVILLAARTQVLACPPGQYESLGMCLPEIGGAVGDAAEHLKNEFNAQLGGNPLAVWLQQSHDTAVGTAMSVPPQIRAQLSGYILEDVMNRARFKVGDNGAINAAAVIQYVNHDVGAVTLIDVIVFRNGSDAYGNPALWAHELTHVQQFGEQGVRDFAIRYMRDPNIQEGPAYAKGNGYASWAAARQAVVRPPVPPFGGFPPTFARFCATQYGSCPMGVAIPAGSPCTCFTNWGPIPGVGR
jgi:hypothetical protein